MAHDLAIIWPSFSHLFPNRLARHGFVLLQQLPLGTWNAWNLSAAPHFSANPPQHAFKWGLNTPWRIWRQRTLCDPILPKAGLWMFMGFMLVMPSKPQKKHPWAHGHLFLCICERERSNGYAMLLLEAEDWRSLDVHEFHRVSTKLWDTKVLTRPNSQRAWE